MAAGGAGKERLAPSVFCRWKPPTWSLGEGVLPSWSLGALSTWSLGEGSLPARSLGEGASSTWSLGEGRPA